MKNLLKHSLILAVAFCSRHLRVRGRERILRVVHHPDRRGAFHVEGVCDYFGGRISFDTRSFCEWQILFYGYYEECNTVIIKYFSKEGSTIVDVGANIGAYSLIAARGVGATGLVLAYEPNPDILKRLLVNCALNSYDHLAVVPMGVSSSKGELKLMIPTAGEGTEPMNASFVAVPSHDYRTVSVAVTTLDDEVLRRKLGRLDFIKIDTEGHDCAVLLGAKTCLARFQPVVLFEFSDQGAGEAKDWAGAFDLLRQLGYRLGTWVRGEITPFSRTGCKIDVSYKVDILAWPETMQLPWSMSTSALAGHSS